VKPTLKTEVMTHCCDYCSWDDWRRRNWWWCCFNVGMYRSSHSRWGYSFIDVSAQWVSVSVC